MSGQYWANSPDSQPNKVLSPAEAREQDIQTYEVNVQIGQRNYEKQRVTRSQPAQAERRAYYALWDAKKAGDPDRISRAEAVYLEAKNILQKIENESRAKQNAEIRRIKQKYNNEYRLKQSEERIKRKKDYTKTAYANVEKVATQFNEYVDLIKKWIEIIGERIPKNLTNQGDIQIANDIRTDINRNINKLSRNLNQLNTINFTNTTYKYGYTYVPTDKTRIDYITLRTKDLINSMMTTYKAKLENKKIFSKLYRAFDKVDDDRYTQRLYDIEKGFFKKTSYKELFDNTSTFLAIINNRDWSTNTNKQFNYYTKRAPQFKGQHAGGSRKPVRKTIRRARINVY